MISTLLVFAFATAFEPAVPAFAVQEDTVTPTEGAAVTGAISKDNLTGVTIKPKSGPPKDFKADQVAKVEYRDAPPPYREATQRYEGGKYREALDKFREADDYVKQVKEDQSKPLGRRMYGDAKPPGKWFEAYNAYFKAECQRQTKDFVGGYDAFMKVIAEQKDFRMTRDAYQGAMRCLIDRSEPKEDEAQKLLTQATAAQAALGEDFIKNLQGTLTELYVRIGDYTKAIAMYKPLAQASDSDVRLKGVRGIIACMIKGDSAELTSYCETLLKADPTNAVKVVAAAALGSRAVAAAAKSNKTEDYRKAVAYLIDATMTYFPGKGKGVDADHEDALYDLAGCYEKMAELYQKSANKDGELLYLIESTGSYRELIAAYPSSDRATEANTKAEELDGRIAALQNKP